jgi:anti-sigma-K factor RskA
MTLDEDKQVLAAEYVLGTLDAEERARVDDMMRDDPDFAVLLGGWERRLGSLAALTASVEPRALLWDKIRTAVVAIESQRVTTATTDAEAGPEKPDEPGSEEAGPDATDPDAIAPTTAASTAVIPFDTTPSAEIVILSQRLRRTRTLAAAIGAIAALLLAFVGVRDFKPEFLPPNLRPATAPQVEPYLAMLQKDGGEPAFMLAVDPDKRRLSVRRIGAEPQQDKSYQLWMVSSAYPAPRSLGVIGADNQEMSLASYNKDAIESATYAVSLEPQGGSPTGAPTGPVMYSGKLVARAS